MMPNGHLVPLDGTQRAMKRIAISDEIGMEQAK